VTRPCARTAGRTESRTPSFAYDADVGEFVNVTLARVPHGFDFFEPLHLLFEWVEKQGYVVTGCDGDLYGSLCGDARVGTSVELRGYTAEQTTSYARSWFGDVTENPAARLWPFAQTGGEGSMAALWLDDDRQTRIVHLGSGSGSLLTCVLADNGLDFLRLLAIGYVEICWSEEFTAHPARGTRTAKSSTRPTAIGCTAHSARPSRQPRWKSFLNPSRWATLRPTTPSADGSTTSKISGGHMPRRDRLASCHAASRANHELSGHEYAPVPWSPVPDSCSYPS
jgi:hypothetical protein